MAVELQASSSGTSVGQKRHFTEDDGSSSPAAKRQFIVNIGVCVTDCLCCILPCMFFVLSTVTNIESLR